MSENQNLPVEEPGREQSAEPERLVAGLQINPDPENRSAANSVVEESVPTDLPQDEGFGQQNNEKNSTTPEESEPSEKPPADSIPRHEVSRSLTPEARGESFSLSEATEATFTSTIEMHFNIASAIEKKLKEAGATLPDNIHLRFLNAFRQNFPNVDFSKPENIATYAREFVKSDIGRVLALELSRWESMTLQVATGTMVSVYQTAEEAKAKGKVYRYGPDGVKEMDSLEEPGFWERVIRRGLLGRDAGKVTLAREALGEAERAEEGREEISYYGIERDDYDGFDDINNIKGTPDKLQPLDDEQKLFLAELFESAESGQTRVSTTVTEAERGQIIRRIVEITEAADEFYESSGIDRANLRQNLVNPAKDRRYAPEIPAYLRVEKVSPSANTREQLQKIIRNAIQNAEKKVLEQQEASRKKSDQELARVQIGQQKQRLVANSELSPEELEDKRKKTETRDHANTNLREIAVQHDQLQSEVQRLTRELTLTRAEINTDEKVRQEYTAAKEAHRKAESHRQSLERHIADLTGDRESFLHVNETIQTEQGPLTRPSSVHSSEIAKINDEIIRVRASLQTARENESNEKAKLDEAARNLNTANDAQENIINLENEKKLINQSERAKKILAAFDEEHAEEFDQLNQGGTEKKVLTVKELEEKIKAMDEEIDRLGKLDPLQEQKRESYETLELVLDGYEQVQQRALRAERGSLDFRCDSRYLTDIKYPPVYLRALQTLFGTEILLAGHEQDFQKATRLLPPERFAQASGLELEKLEAGEAAITQANLSQDRINQILDNCIARAIDGTLGEDPPEKKALIESMSVITADSLIPFESGQEADLKAKQILEKIYYYSGIDDLAVRIAQAFPELTRAGEAKAYAIEVDKRRRRLMRR